MDSEYSVVDNLVKYVEELKDANASLIDDLDKAQMSNQRLIAELGRVAAALDVEPSMVKVLARIEELKATPRKPGGVVWYKLEGHSDEQQMSFDEAVSQAPRYMTRDGTRQILRVEVAAVVTTRTKTDVEVTKYEGT